MMAVKVPTPGRDVYYKSKTGNYVLPAKVVVTQDNLFHEGVLKGDIPSLDSPVHVHLRVSSPGEDYVEENCPHAALHPDYHPSDNPFPAGSWSWPELVPDRMYEREGGMVEDLLPLSASHIRWEGDRRI